MIILWLEGIKGGFLIMILEKMKREVHTRNDWLCKLPLVNFISGTLIFHHDE